jgi:hypothetical protein
MTDSSFSPGAKFIWNDANVTIKSITDSAHVLLEVR